MNYYQDLGVAPSATAEEIRDTYHALVRLFHPDQQTDPGLKIAAEAQMRRFNDIYAVLGDPERRRVYNAELLAATERLPPIIIHAPRPVADRSPVPWGTVAWGSAVIVSAGLIIWLSNHDFGSHADAPPWATIGAQQPSEVGAAPPVPAPGLIDDAGARAIIGELRRQLRTAIAQRDDAWRLLNQSRRESQGASTTSSTRGFDSRAANSNTSPSPPETPAMDLPPPIAAPLPTLAVAAPSVPPASLQSHFAGIWLWTKPEHSNKSKALYPPEYIETSIVERNGSLHGRYRARYRVSDRAISPNVYFEFEGKASGISAQLPFSGEGGAKGQVKMKLITDNSLELNWSVTDLGKELGLASGTAILIRKID